MIKITIDKTHTSQSLIVMFMDQQYRFTLPNDILDDQEGRNMILEMIETKLTIDSDLSHGEIERIINHINRNVINPYKD